MPSPRAHRGSPPTPDGCGGRWPSPAAAPPPEGHGRALRAARRDKPLDGTPGEGLGGHAAGVDLLHLLYPPNDKALTAAAARHRHLHRQPLHAGGPKKRPRRARLCHGGPIASRRRILCCCPERTAWSASSGLQAMERLGEVAMTSSLQRVQALFIARIEQMKADRRRQRAHQDRHLGCHQVVLSAPGHARRAPACPSQRCAAARAGPRPPQPSGVSEEILYCALGVERCRCWRWGALPESKARYTIYCPRAHHFHPQHRLGAAAPAGDSYNPGGPEKAL